MRPPALPVPLGLTSLFAPDVFRPERFLGQRPPALAWVPFGGVLKRCIGAAFAMRELTTVLHTLLRAGTLRPADSRPERPRGRAGPVLVPYNGTRVFFTPAAQPSTTAASAHP